MLRESTPLGVIKKILQGGLEPKKQGKSLLVFYRRGTQGIAEHKILQE
jgi:hypothetical protein